MRQQTPELRRVHIARISFAFLLIGVLLLLLLVLSLSSFGDDACGTERVDIKQLKDPHGLSAASGPSHLTTVAEMLKLPLHTKGALLKDSSIRLSPTETTVYEIHAVVIGFKRETDQDIHIVIADPGKPKQTMIVEIPAGDCMPPALAAKYNGLQSDFQQKFGHATAKFKTLPKPVPFDVTGVGFFDFVHGQTGHAPNGVELHPVIGFK